MVFGATYACAPCRLRFARLERCPSCGGAAIFSLTTREGRSRFGKAAQGASCRWRDALRLLRAWFTREGAIAVSPAAGTAVRARVHAPAITPRDDDTTLTGIARRASVEIASPFSDEPCLLFGLRGQVGTADVCDADGGDFDLELPSGELVMISLEHAVLESAATGEPRYEIGIELARLLEQRAISAAEGGAQLDAVIVFDGDEVTVIGTVLGGKVTSLAYRGASAARVLAGAAVHPLRVRTRAGSRK